MSNQTFLYFNSFIKNSRVLSHKEKDILLSRLKKKRLKTLGRRYKVSAEWIRQLEKHALGKFFKKINQLLLFD